MHLDHGDVILKLWNGFVYTGLVIRIPNLNMREKMRSTLVMAVVGVRRLNANVD
jgi:hypothetical protein